MATLSTADPNAAHSASANGLKASIFHAIYSTEGSSTTTRKNAAEVAPVSLDDSLSDATLIEEPSSPETPVTTTAHLIPRLNVEDYDTVVRLRSGKEMNIMADEKYHTDISKQHGLEWIKACRKGDVARCRKLLDENPQLISYKTPLHYDYTAVHMSVIGKHFDLMHLLFSRRADFNAKTVMGYTVLHLAAQAQDSSLVSLLINSFGLRPEVLDYMGYTYKHYANWLDEAVDYDESAWSWNRRGSNKSTRSRPQSMISQDSQLSEDSARSVGGGSGGGAASSVREAVKGLLKLPGKIVRSRSNSMDRREKK